MESAAITTDCPCYKMKKTLITIVVCIIIVSTKRYILSVFDGVSLVKAVSCSDYVDLSEAKLTAETAERIIRGICSGIMREGVSHFVIHEDKMAYYFMHWKPFMTSYYAKMNGIKMRKIDGSILFPGMKAWMQSGYLDMSVSEFQSIATQGTKSAEIERLFGRPYRQRYCAIIDTNNFYRGELRVDDYICKNSSQNIMFRDNICITNRPSETVIVVATIGAFPFLVTRDF